MIEGSSEDENDTSVVRLDDSSFMGGGRRSRTNSIAGYSKGSSSNGKSIKSLLGDKFRKR